MNFETKVKIQLKILGAGLVMLGLFCSYHQITLNP